MSDEDKAAVAAAAVRRRGSVVTPTAVAARAHPTPYYSTDERAVVGREGRRTRTGPTRVLEPANPGRSTKRSTGPRGVGGRTRSPSRHFVRRPSATGGSITGVRAALPQGRKNPGHGPGVGADPRGLGVYSGGPG